jgi:peroxiredoxin
LGIEIVGISRDLGPSQGVFAEQVGARNRFVSDVDATIINRYGALGPRGVANRYYFLIDEDGTVIWKNVTGQLIPVEALLTELRGAVGD